MTIEPTENFVDPNTDDLDSFSSLLNGKAQAKAEDTPEIQDDKVDVVDDEPEIEDNVEDIDSPDEDTDKDDKSKKKNRFQERINDLTAKARENERTANAEREKNRQLEERLAKLESKQDPVKATPQKESNLPDPLATNEDGSDKYPLGEFDPTYIRDLNRAIIEEERAAYREKEEKEQVQKQEQEVRAQLQTQWVEKLETAVEQHEDFLDKTLQLESAFDNLDPQYSDYLVQTIKSLDHGPEVLYYFANNLDEAKKFVKMGPQAATLALGEYNSMFKGQSRKETKVSNAPPPPQVNKGSTTRKTVSGDTEDLDAFEDMFFKRKR